MTISLGGFTNADGTGADVGGIYEFKVDANSALQLCTYVIEWNSEKLE